MIRHYYVLLFSICLVILLLLLFIRRPRCYYLPAVLLSACLWPPLAGAPYESWGKLTIGRRRPIVGGPRGQHPLAMSLATFPPSTVQPAAPAGAGRPRPRARARARADAHGASGPALLRPAPPPPPPHAPMEPPALLAFLVVSLVALLVQCPSNLDYQHDLYCRLSIDGYTSESY